MEIHRKNNTRPADDHTHRIQFYSENTKNFRISVEQNGSAIIMATCLDYDWEITLSKEEADVLRKTLL